MDFFAPSFPKSDYMFGFPHRPSKLRILRFIFCMVDNDAFALNEVG